MSSLVSHYQPSLTLAEHIKSVKRAADFLLSNHNRQTIAKRPETQNILDAIIKCHDLGKGSPAFQKYIQDPESYRGPGLAKSHAALSAALGLLWAREQGWKPLAALVLAEVIAGHHAGFSSLEYLKNIRLQPDDDGLLEEQWNGLEHARLGRATSLDLSRINGEFDDGGRWLFRRSDVEEELQCLSLEEGIRFRLWTQFVFSILLEADKALLAFRDQKKLYLSGTRPAIKPDLVDRFITTLPATPLDSLRRQARNQVLGNLNEQHRYFTITLPTGVGKTLTAADWAFTLRQRLVTANKDITAKIIVVLPYLSIIDQTEQIYRKLLGLEDQRRSATEFLMASHSLSERSYELEGDSLKQNYSDFFLDTWRSELVITTFDQLLLALFSPKARYLMRFHQLLDAIIIMDEIQAIPCRLWDPVDQVLRALAAEGEARILMMSATQPAILQNTRELVGDNDEVAEIFGRFKRYRIVLRHRQSLKLPSFIDELRGRIPEWVAKGERVLVTLNTRASCRAVYDELLETLDETGMTSYLLSADLTPFDRLQKIDCIKSGSPCLVVSTQTVEAGVDIDMDVVIRDFAPLDSIIQIAGRCNRNNHKGDHGGLVEVVSLQSSRGKSYMDMIYDPVLLDVSKEVFTGHEEIGEEAVLALSRKYFSLLKIRRNIGKEITSAFARWEEFPDIRSLFRGDATKQVSFIARSDSDPHVDQWINKLREALAIDDRWERRSALRGIAGKLQKRTVTVYARPDMFPEDYAEPVGPFWLLKDGYYSSDRGIDLKLDEENPACIF